DAVMVGMGWTGSILARELTKAGLTVVGLERGPDRIPGQDFVLPTIRDELRYGRRSEFIADNSIETVTFRHFPNESALPMRRCGTSGKAGNLRGTLVPGGNPFEGARSSEYPNKPLKQGHAGELFEKAATELGYHPFPLPASNASAPYLNSEGIQIGACQYCGF